MTPEELRENLIKLGLDPESPNWTKTKSIDLGKLPFIQHQRESLQKVADLLEAQKSSNEEKILTLREALSRLNRGGGA